jgi:hypothetical protein
MNNVTLPTLRALAAVEVGPCVSIYMPTCAVGRGAAQDAIRLRTLVESVERTLIDRGMNERATSKFLSRILDLPKDDKWQHRKSSLAIFHSPQLSATFWLPDSLEPACTVRQRFFLKTLLPFQRTPVEFIVLAISRNRVRMLRVDEQSFERLSVPKLPHNMKTALNLQPADRGEQVHSAMHVRRRKEAAVFHGQGGHRETFKNELSEYYRLINHAITPILQKRSCPLILAGVDYELALFRRICDYGFISDKNLCGCFDHLDDRQLCAAARQLTWTSGDEMKHRAVTRYMNQADTCLATDDLEEIMAAVHAGRVDLLLVKAGQDVFGRFDPTNNSIETVDERGPDVDLVELAIEQCLMNGGEVYSVNETLSSKSPMHAIVRYW